MIRKRKEKVLTVSDYLVSPFECEGNRIRFTLQAKKEGSLRPDVLLDNCTIDANLISLMRVAQSAEFDAE